MDCTGQSVDGTALLSEQSPGPTFLPHQVFPALFDKPSGTNRRNCPPQERTHSEYPGARISGRSLFRSSSFAAWAAFPDREATLAAAVLYHGRTCGGTVLPGHSSIVGTPHRFSAGWG